jgi:hypothetical protein
MKIIRQTVYVKPDDLPIIENDINSQQSYTIFANHEIGTKPVEIHIYVNETFVLEEDELDLLIESLCPHLNDGDLNKKKEELKARFRRN